MVPKEYQRGNYVGSLTLGGFRIVQGSLGGARLRQASMAQALPILPSQPWIIPQKITVSLLKAVLCIRSATQLTVEKISNEMNSDLVASSPASLYPGNHGRGIPRIHCLPPQTPQASAVTSTAKERKPSATTSLFRMLEGGQR
jgi:hypothetical protein